MLNSTGNYQSRI